jgi:hypothetical protein
MSIMAICVFVAFLAGWALGGFAVYSYLIISTRGQSSPDVEEIDDDDTRLREESAKAA